LFSEAALVPLFLHLYVCTNSWITAKGWWNDTFATLRQQKWRPMMWTN